MEASEDVFADLLSGLQPRHAQESVTEKYVSMDETRRRAMSDGEPEEIQVHRSNSPIGDNLRPPPPPLTKEDVQTVVRETVRELLFQSFGSLTTTLKTALDSCTNRIGKTEATLSDLCGQISSIAENQSTDSESFTEKFRQLDMTLKTVSVGVQRMLEKQDLMDAHVLLNRHAKDEQAERVKNEQDEKRAKLQTAPKQQETAAEAVEEEDPPAPVVQPKKTVQAPAASSPVEQYSAEQNASDRPVPPALFLAAQKVETVQQPAPYVAPVPQAGGQLPQRPMQAPSQTYPVSNAAMQQSPPQGLTYQHNPGQSVTTRPPLQQPAPPTPQTVQPPPQSVYQPPTPAQQPPNTYKPPPPSYNYPPIHMAGENGFNPQGQQQSQEPTKPLPPGYPSMMPSTAGTNPYNPSQPVPPGPQHASPPGSNLGVYSGYPTMHNPQSFRPSPGIFGALPPGQPPARPPPPQPQRQAEAGRTSAQSIPLEQVINDVANMGFDRIKVRSVVTQLLDHGESIDLNVVIDRLTNY